LQILVDKQRPRRLEGGDKAPAGRRNPGFFFNSFDFSFFKEPYKCATEE
jgi:hypothetical protein